MTKTILITGCSTGLGFAAARLFAHHDYRVIATVRSEDDAARVQAENKVLIHPVLCDVTLAKHVAALPGHVRAITGGNRLDGLINNAGMMLEPGPFELQNLDTIRAQFDVNLFGMMAVTQVLLPLLGTAEPAGGHAGRIINLSSIEGKVASPFISAYAATKHAIEGFSASLRRELRLFGIKVIIVAPGGIKTEMWRKNTFPVEPVLGTPYADSFGKTQPSAERHGKGIGHGRGNRAPAGAGVRSAQSQGALRALKGPHGWRLDNAYPRSLV